MNLLAGLALVIRNAVDPCQPVEPAPQPDPAAASAYLAVGESERASGSTDTAAAAYREALRLDPTLASARDALQALCHPGPSADELFAEGRRRMEAGDLRGAATAFARERALGPDPGAALLEGICHYQLGEDAQARPLLEEARRTPELADSASFYLGLLALRSGAPGAATPLLAAASASGDPRLAAAAGELLSRTHREGRLVLSAFVASGYDSNVDLSPDATPGTAPGADGDASVTGSALVHPFGGSGPYAKASATYRKQFSLTDFDLGAVQGAAGWQLSRPIGDLAGEYAYDFLALGGAPYLSSHRLQARGALHVSRLTLALTYLARFESYLTTDAAPFSGVRQAALPGAELLFGSDGHLGLSYKAERDGASDSALAYWEHGPTLYLEVHPLARLRLGVSAAAFFRAYDELDPDLGVARADQYLDGAGVAEVDLGDHWSVQLSANARKAFSNVEDFNYTRLAANLGLAYAVGLF